MDVFDHYKPELTEQRFRPGPIPDDDWARFLQLVRYAHAYAHWDQALRDNNAQRLRNAGPSHRTGAFTTAPDVGEARDHSRYLLHTCAYYAADTLLDLYVRALDRPGTLEECLACAAVEAVRLDLRRDLADQVNADWRVLAFAEFDAERDLTDAPVTLANKWREAALSEL